MTPDAVREQCRRWIPQALATMFTIVVDPGVARTTRLAAVRQLVDLLEGKVVSIDAFRAARDVAHVTDAEWLATVRELRDGRRAVGWH